MQTMILHHVRVFAECAAGSHGPMQWLNNSIHLQDSINAHIHHNEATVQAYFSLACTNTGMAGKILLQSQVAMLTMRDGVISPAGSTDYFALSK